MSSNSVPGAAIFDSQDYPSEPGPEPSKTPLQDVANPCEPLQNASPATTPRVVSEIRGQLTGVLTFKESYYLGVYFQGSLLGVPIINGILL